MYWTEGLSLQQMSAELPGFPSSQHLNFKCPSLFVRLLAFFSLKPLDEEYIRPTTMLFQQIILSFIKIQNEQPGQ